MQLPVTALSITALNHMARELLEAQLPLLLIEGEISNLVRASSGHLYFSLKDAHSQIRAVMFKTQAMGIRFKVADGLLVTVRARLSVYTARGDMQLIVQQMDKAGAGELQAAFLRLKERLNSEGLFANNRPLPTLCTHLLVITSPQGAVLQDVTGILRRRYPALPVTVLPAAVQGEKAAHELRMALTQIHKVPDADVVLICRGGGSVEDLWAFNDEALARAIFSCPLPVISAVGHETDFTIADFVADIRAATPSAAAELVSESAIRCRQQLDTRLHQLHRALQHHLPELQRIDQLQLRLEQLVQHYLRSKQELLRTTQKRLRPPQQQERWQLPLHNSQQSLLRLMQLHLKSYQQTLNQRSQLLEQQNPRQRLRLMQLRFQDLQQRLQQSLSTLLQRQHDALTFLAHRAHSSSPLQTMERGYSLLFKQETLIRHSRQLHPGDLLNARLRDGSAELSVLRVHSTDENADS